MRRATWLLRTGKKLTTKAIVSARPIVREAFLTTLNAVTTTMLVVPLPSLFAARLTVSTPITDHEALLDTEIGGLVAELKAMKKVTTKWTRWKMNKACTSCLK